MFVLELLNQPLSDHFNVCRLYFHELDQEHASTGQFGKQFLRALYQTLEAWV